MVLLQVVKPFVEPRDIIASLALILGIINLLLGPRYLKRLEREKEAHSRRVNIFKALMTTRGAKLSYRHVEALNSIDLEFLDQRFASVITARNDYYDLIFNRPEDSNLSAVWSEKMNDFLADLLHKMSQLLGYKHSLVDIKRNIYTPMGHVEAENEETAIRKGLVSLLHQREGFISVDFQQDENATAEAADKQRQVYDLMISYYTRKLNKNNRSEEKQS